MSKALRVIDHIDKAVCRAGLIKAASWSDLLGSSMRYLYAGRLYRELPQYSSYWGITPYFPSSRNINHDAGATYPIDDATVDRYQSEDVFEHIELNRIPSVIDEIHRVLKPGGLFRLSLPDYHLDLNRDRCEKDDAGEIIFDPLGGGTFEHGVVAGGGHLWFPTIELIRSLFAKSSFARDGEVQFLHYNNADGSTVTEPVDYNLGYIKRTPGHDNRVADRWRAVSIVVDAYKR